MPAPPSAENSDSKPSWAELVAPGAVTGPGEPQTRRQLRGSTRRRGRRENTAYGFLPTRPPRRKRRWVVFLVVPVVLALVFGGGAAAAAWLLFPDQVRSFLGSRSATDYPGTGTGEVLIVIQDGQVGADIAKTLVRADVTKSFSAFYNLLVKTTPPPVFQPGAYRMARQMSARAALDALLNPASRLNKKVVVTEGSTLANVLPLIAANTDIPLADLKAAAANYQSFGLPPEAKTLEGFLFPATYQFDPGTTAQEALKKMVDRSFSALDAAGVPPEKRYATVTLAALIQREARLKEDFYRVSRVFQNRLQSGWLLQSDATVAYGTGKTNLVTTTDAERADASNPYNTYVHPGLPVGPISNPGDLAIDAALRPVAGPWFFFVTVNLDTGETVFSTTEAEHAAARDRWLQWMAANPQYG